jgi:hypothetical protein
MMSRRRSTESLEDGVAERIEDSADDPEAVPAKRDARTLPKTALTDPSGNNRQLG